MQESANLAYLHNNSLQSSNTVHYGVNSSLSDYSPDVPSGMHGVEACLTPQLPLGLPGLPPSVLGGLSYVTIPQFPGTMYNPFQLQGKLLKGSGGLTLYFEREVSD